MIILRKYGTTQNGLTFQIYELPVLPKQLFWEIFLKHQKLTRLVINIYLTKQFRLTRDQYKRSKYN